MSVATTRHYTVEYRWCFPMIPWYRQVLSLIYGLGVMLIALWAIDQGQGPYMILGVVVISMVTLMLIFGIEIDSIQFMDSVHIEFTDTGNGNDDE